MILNIFRQTTAFFLYKTLQSTDLTNVHSILMTRTWF